MKILHKKYSTSNCTLLQDEHKYEITEKRSRESTRELQHYLPKIIVRVTATLKNLLLLKANTLTTVA